MNSRLRDRLLVAGSANLDFVVRASHVPAQGETVLGRDFANFPGGKGANQAVACARAGGVATRMLLALGDDVFARTIEESLLDAGVDLRDVQIAARHADPRTTMRYDRASTHYAEFGTFYTGAIGSLDEVLDASGLAV